MYDCRYFFKLSTAHVKNVITVEYYEIPFVMPILGANSVVIEVTIRISNLFGTSWKLLGLLSHYIIK